MLKTQAKIQSLSTAEWHQYHQLLENRRLVDYFADEIRRFAHSQLKPEDVLRRFSLNGDGQLDLKEFHLAAKRLGIISGADNGDSSAAQRKSRELFSVFSPSHNKKLDIDMFCRIMNEWSMQLFRLQQQLPTEVSPLLSSGSSGRSSATIPTPYAIESSSSSPDKGIVNTDGELVWRRMRDVVLQNLDKLSQIFFKMDIACSGSISQDEFELAMSHIGVFLTKREYEKLYEALPFDLKNFHAPGASENSFGIRYAGFLANIQGQHPQASKHTLPASAQTSSPPISTNVRLWDLLVLALDKLESLIRQYERAYHQSVSAETFRDILMRCGLQLSNPDYAALRVRLLPFTDGNGVIDLSALLHALKSHERSAMTSTVQSSAIPLALNSSTANFSPIRTGRKTVFASPQDNMSPSSISTPHPAGKSNEQRNVEANRTAVRIRDESRWKSDLNINQSVDSPRKSATESDTSSQRGGDDEGGVQPYALERRILLKLQQLKDVGQLGSSSPQSVFSGDRFGRITRGQFRQSIVHLGIVARYAEVETLFWTLDPSGRGYIVNQDLYDHLNTSATRIRASDLAAMGLPQLNPDSTTSPGRLPRSVQKIFEGMLHQFRTLLSICERKDPQRTGLITRPDLMAAIQELGILASPQDVQSALVAITQRVELLAGRDQQAYYGSVNASPPLADPYHPNGIVYSKLESRLKQLCSDLLSPKKRRQHLTTASVLLAPQEEIVPLNGRDDYNMNMANETDALWNCPRRKMNQDHRAAKSSIKIADQIYDEVEGSSGSGSPSYQNQRHSPPRHNSDVIDKRQRGRRLAMISILQDLLERRGDLKSVMDLHRNADVHGQVSKRDLVEILMVSRLNLNFSTSTYGIAAHEFVDTLYPQNDQTVGFLDLLHRISDLLAELSHVNPAAPNPTGLYGNNAYPRETARRLHTAGAVPSLSAPVSTGGLHGGSKTNSMPQFSLFPSDELSLQRKVLYESRLSDLLLTEKGRQSAAILIRHAFKGVMARELVVPIDNGEFEAVCRVGDLKHVCFRLGLDLDVAELHFLVTSIDVNQSGYVSSPQLLQFFTHLAIRGTSARSNSGRGQDALQASPRLS
ncbi:hypothetical protein Poli38472_009258 [Pythium oligandrum]|uniref:EF-hand domain-containing protein n=1 Tax=Pythium oligandrum TaxID=41045 RepID=A0A8K1CK43_PYTOL|nr:hypothetical protein Poli38472_009258 [Pythium oligandrum]|eukprot:TMW65091.1 hypothetical protein Poli38472_009258 [Pythium oligandrum]